VQNHQVLRSAFLLLLAARLSDPSAAAQQPALSSTIPAKMVVTVEGRHGSAVPLINRDDVMVYEGHDRDQVTDWIPLQGDRAGLELFIVLDDGLSTSVGSQLSDLQKFISSQPATTAIGIGYMRNGTVAVAQDPTTDHARAAKALRIPIGSRGISASPYLSIADLIKKWPARQDRQEILMISDGVDSLYGGGPGDPYVDEAIEAAQKAGVIVFSIYSSGAGHSGHSFWRTNWGQNYESQLCDQTGGESYYQGFGSPISFTPYLQDVGEKLKHQYLLTFAAKSEKKAGLRKVKLNTEVPNAELVAADKAFTPATE